MEKKVKIDEIVVKFYTRRCLEDDKIEMFALLMEEGTVFPPIEVTPDEPPALIDGRSRIEAYKLRDVDTVKCIVCPHDTEAGYKARALKANYGGSQPNTRDDISRTIQAMLQDGATGAQIAKMLSFIPERMVKKLVDFAGQQIRTNKVAQAKRDMRDGATVEEVKKKYGKDGEWIVNKILDEPKNKKKDRRLAMLSEQGAISTKIKSLAALRSKVFKQINILYEEGIISANEAFVVFTTWKDSVRVMERSVDDYIARFVVKARDNGEGPYHARKAGSNRKGSTPVQPSPSRSLPVQPQGV